MEIWQKRQSSDSVSWNSSATTKFLAQFGDKTVSRHRPFDNSSKGPHCEQVDERIHTAVGLQEGRKEMVNYLIIKFFLGDDDVAVVHDGGCATDIKS